MNFYKHHLGDYDGATAHLDWLEDMAYTRLLRAYYRRETALPLDAVATCRLVRAASPAQRRAVDTVLAEFFERKEDGWHNKRADAEIATYRAQAATNRRIARERSGERSEDGSLHGSSDDSSHGSSTKDTPNHKPDTRSHKPEESTSKPLASSDESLSADDSSKNGSAVAYIPLVDGSDFGITASHIEAFEKAYPAVDCTQTLHEIRAWCVANPKNQKTRAGALRFVNSWLSREQNKAR